MSSMKGNKCDRGRTSAGNPSTSVRQASLLENKRLQLCETPDMYEALLYRLVHPTKPVQARTLRLTHRVMNVRKLYCHGLNGCVHPPLPLISVLKSLLPWQN